MLIIFYDSHKDLPFNGKSGVSSSCFDLVETARWTNSETNQNITETSLWNLFLGLHELEWPEIMAHVSILINKEAGTFTLSDTFKMKLGFTAMLDERWVVLTDLSFSSIYLYEKKSIEISKKSVYEWKRLIKSFIEKQKNEKIKTKVFLETQVKELDSVIKMYPGNL